MADNNEINREWRQRMVQGGLFAGIDERYAKGALTEANKKLLENADRAAALKNSLHVAKGHSKVSSVMQSSAAAVAPVGTTSGSVVVNNNVSHIPNNHPFGNQSRNFRLQRIEQQKGFLAEQKQKLTGLLDNYHAKRKAGANAATLEHIKDVSREVRAYIGDLEASIAEIEDEIRTRYRPGMNNEFKNLVKGLRKRTRRSSAKTRKSSRKNRSTTRKSSRND